MYSLAPLANIPDTHIGLICISIILLACLSPVLFDSHDLPISVAITIGLIWIIAFAVSFGTSSEKIYENREVTAKFVDYVPQLSPYACGHKNRSTCYTDRVFGRFSLPKGEVLLHINPAYVMPPYVKLYWNDTKE